MATAYLDHHWSSPKVVTIQPRALPDGSRLNPEAAEDNPSHSGTAQAIGNVKPAKKLRRLTNTDKNAIKWLTELSVSVILPSFLDGVATAAACLAQLRVRILAFFVWEIYPACCVIASHWHPDIKHRGDFTREIHTGLGGSDLCRGPRWRGLHHLQRRTTLPRLLPDQRLCGPWQTGHRRS